MDKKKIYTFGYTLFFDGLNKDVSQIFETLREYNISYLVDVRSVPYSKQFPQCNEENLKRLGSQYGIPYVHLPEIGAKVSSTKDVFSKASDIIFEDVFPIPRSNRPEKTELNGFDEIVDFSKIRNDENFVKGIKRIEKAYQKNYTLALMCSEKNPMDCHRFFLISKALEQNYGDCMEVVHLVRSKEEGITCIGNKDVEKLLQDTVMKRRDVAKLDLLSPSFFGPSKLEKYYGTTQEEKINDFCGRYWNILHGWKRFNYNNNQFEEYD